MNVRTVAALEVKSVTPAAKWSVGSEVSNSNSNSKSNGFSICDAVEWALGRQQDLQHL